MQTPRLHRDNDWWFSQTKNNLGNPCWGFCADDVAKYFDIPKKAKYVWFVTGPKPNKYRHAVRISWAKYLLILERSYFMTSQTLRSIAAKGLNNKTIYVECHWK